MKIDFVKTFGGVLTPFSELDSEKMVRFKTGEVYSVDIKTSQNPAFRGKVFTFFDFCFQYWCNKNEYLTAQANKRFFRQQLVKLAGYYDEYYDLFGEVTLKAKSLSYENMSPEEFEDCYSACIQAAIDTIFKGCDEKEMFYYKGKEVAVYEKLMSFF